MSYQAEAATARFLREEEELEGTLLPVATPIIGNFEYETAMVEEQEQVAYPIPQISDNTAVSDDSRPRVRQAQRTGRMAAEEENEAIRKANRKVFAHNYHEKEALRNANDIARERDRDGLRMKEDEFQIRAQEEEKRISEAKSSESKPKAAGYQVGGYAVKDYQFGGDYDTSEYQASEYKSVYD
jgi:hypothetical protein